MRIKSKLKNSTLFIFILLLLVGGVLMFRGLINNKQVFESDLYAYLPSDVSAVLQINKKKDLDKTITYFDKLSFILTKMESAISFPIILVQYEQENYLILKVTSSQESEIKNKLNNTIFPSFPPKEKIYKDATLYFYMISDDEFFICTFKDRIFIGGFNIGLFEKYIDNRQDSNLGIIGTPLGKDILNQMKPQYDANLFLNNGASFSTFNVSLDTTKIQMDGYNTQPNYRNWKCREIATDTLNVNYSLFPNSLVGYKVEMNNPLIADTIKCLFSPPSYSFILKDKMSLVYALKYNRDKLYIYDQLNEFEETNMGRKLQINAFHLGYRIYITSKQLAKDIFNLDGSVYFVFYKDYMIFSENKDALADYLDHNGKFDLNNCFHTNQINQPLDAIIYCKDLKNWYLDFINSDNPILQKNSVDVYITSTITNKRNIYKVLINN